MLPWSTSDRREARQIEIKAVGDEGIKNEVASADEGRLATMLFDRITEELPHWPMGDRSDLAMSLFTVVKKWAHENDDTRPVR